MEIDDIKRQIHKRIAQRAGCLELLNARLRACERFAKIRQDEMLTAQASHDTGQYKNNREEFAQAVKLIETIRTQINEQTAAPLFTGSEWKRFVLEFKSIAQMESETDAEKALCILVGMSP
jgi:hypothetical protein